MGRADERSGLGTSRGAAPAGGLGARAGGRPDALERPPLEEARGSTRGCPQAVRSAAARRRRAPAAEGVATALARRGGPLESMDQVRRRVDSMGSFGEVKLAMREDNEQMYAVKVFGHAPRSWLRASDLLTESFVLNGVGASLCHPNVVSFLEYVVDESRFLEGREQFVLPVMELLRGPDLFDWLQVRQQRALQGLAPWISRSEAASIALQVASALAYIHGNAPALVHRDVKPENLRWASAAALDAKAPRLEQSLATGDSDALSAGPLKLVDFGTVYVEGYQDALEGLLVVGTPLYMAPEAFQDWEEHAKGDEEAVPMNGGATFRSQVVEPAAFSFALLVLWQMLIAEMVESILLLSLDLGCPGARRASDRAEMTRLGHGAAPSMPLSWDALGQVIGPRGRFSSREKAAVVSYLSNAHWPQTRLFAAGERGHPRCCACGEFFGAMEVVRELSRWIAQASIVWQDMDSKGCEGLPECDERRTAVTFAVPLEERADGPRAAPVNASGAPPAAVGARGEQAGSRPAAVGAWASAARDGGVALGALVFAVAGHALARARCGEGGDQQEIIACGAYARLGGRPGPQPKLRERCPGAAGLPRSLRGQKSRWGRGLRPGGTPRARDTRGKGADAHRLRMEAEVPQDARVRFLKWLGVQPDAPAGVEGSASVADAAGGGAGDAAPSSTELPAAAGGAAAGAGSRQAWLEAYGLDEESLLSWAEEAEEARLERHIRRRRRDDGDGGD
ncbi:unnamed protein product [Prorocentrum cordatum]|uniref:Protein kinase domain-containing protein n=1 Tax=Prorocentrum cordatum TaxID=2364126 RepID=A0ABN9TEB6_9DINO|nr:unnamed protein product [Polarella glacialis]